MRKTRVFEVKCHVVFSAQSAEARFPRTKIVVAPSEPQIFSPPKAEFLEGRLPLSSSLHFVFNLAVTHFPQSLRPKVWVSHRI